MNEDKIKKGRQWEDGIILPVSDAFFAKKDDSGTSITDKVYNELRRMILYDDITPGSWIRQDSITRQLEVSRTPVREALRSLNRECLIELVPNYGAKVASLTIDEFEEIYAYRKGIEALAIRRAVVKLSYEHFQKLESMIEVISHLANTENLSEYLKEEWNFRFWLYSIGGREGFLAQIKDYRERAERYLRYAYINEASIQESFELHNKLFQACKRIDVGKAEQIVQNLLSWTVDKAGPILASKLM